MILLAHPVLYCRPRPYAYIMCAIMCDYELLSKTRFASDWAVFIQGHSAVPIRFLLPIFMCKSLLPECCVNKGSYYPMYKSLLPQRCVNNVLLPLFMYNKSLLPLGCVNKGSYYPSTCTSLYCHSAGCGNKVFTTPLHVQALAATVLCQ